MDHVKERQKVKKYPLPMCWIRTKNHFHFGGVVGVGLNFTAIGQGGGGKSGLLIAQQKALGQNRGIAEAVFE
jgi:hypothetical protein